MQTFILWRKAMENVNKAKENGDARVCTCIDFYGVSQASLDWVRAKIGSELGFETRVYRHGGLVELAVFLKPADLKRVVSEMVAEGPGACTHTKGYTQSEQSRLETMLEARGYSVTEEDGWTVMGKCKEVHDKPPR